MYKVCALHDFSDSDHICYSCKTLGYQQPKSITITSDRLIVAKKDLDLHMYIKICNTGGNINIHKSKICIGFEKYIKPFFFFFSFF